ncbi:hypothetical protein ACTFIY_002696 [Dictyostelium cf. discoideum]
MNNKIVFLLIILISPLVLFRTNATLPSSHKTFLNKTSLELTIEVPYIGDLGDKFEILTSPGFIIFHSDFESGHSDDNYFILKSGHSVTFWFRGNNDRPLTQFWGTYTSRICFKTIGEFIDCSGYLYDYASLDPFDVKIDKGRPSTSGGEVTLSGKLLLFNLVVKNGFEIYPKKKIINGGLNQTIGIIKGDLTNSKSFDCTNVTVQIPPGYGQRYIRLGYKNITKMDFQYAPPTISNITFDESKSELFINGGNFYFQFLGFNKTKITIQKVIIDDIAINETNIEVTKDHTQIKVKNFNRYIPGPISIFISVDDIPIEKNYIGCLYPTITSISSVSNSLGGIVTINGFILSYGGNGDTTTTTVNSSLIPTINIGDKICKPLTFSTTEIKCKLDSNNDGGSNLPTNISFNNNFTLYGFNIGRENESIIQIYGQDINPIIIINKFNGSIDEKTLTFQLPLLTYRVFNVLVKRDNKQSDKAISLSAKLSIIVTNKPLVRYGELIIALYYLDNSLITTTTNPSITFEGFNNKLYFQCSLPIYKSNLYFYTICPTPFGIGINKPLTLSINSSIFVNSTFSYASPVVFFHNFSINNNNNIIITINGMNFGNSSQSIQVYLSNNNITNEIQLIDNNQFIFQLLESYENGPINIIVDNNKLESPYNLTLPPFIIGIIDKIVGCSGAMVSISGKRLLSNVDQDLKVFINNEESKIINSSDTVLLVTTNQIKSSKINVTVYFAPNLTFSNSKQVNFFEPIITIIANGKNDDYGFSIEIGGYGFSDSINASLIDSNYHYLTKLICDLQCNSSPKNQLNYNETITISSNEADITNSTDILLCYSKRKINKKSIILILEFEKKLNQFILEINSSLVEFSSDQTQS